MMRMQLLLSQKICFASKLKKLILKYITININMCITRKAYEYELISFIVKEMHINQQEYIFYP